MRERYQNMLKNYKAYTAEKKNTPTGSGKPLERKKYYDLLDEHLSEDCRVAGVTKQSIELGLHNIFDSLN